MVRPRAGASAARCARPRGSEAARPRARVHEHRLPGEEVQLAEEAGRAVPDDLVSGRVDDGDLAFEDRDERIRPIADLVEEVADLGRALFPDLGERRQLRRREQGAQWARGCRHARSFLQAGRVKVPRRTYLSQA